MENAYVINEVKTDSSATIASASTCNTVDTDASNTENESSMYLISLYADAKCYYFEDHPIFQKLIEKSGDKVIFRIAAMLYADCVAWRRDTIRYYDLKDANVDRLKFGIELIKFGYGIIARRDLLYAMFVKDDTAEVKEIHCPEDIESYTIRDIEEELDYMDHLIGDTVSVISEYGYNNPEVIFAMEVVNSCIM